MAQLKEGRCYNCGSLLWLDPEMEKGHCIYCDAVFSNTEAFAIAENPDAYTFENKEMEPYTGPSLEPKRATATPVHFTPPPRATATTQEKKPQYEIKVREIPEVKADRKIMMIAGAAVALVCLIFLAVIVPLTVKRDRQRDLMAARFATAVKEIGGSQEEAVLGKDFVISGMKNDGGILLLHEISGEADAERYYEAFREARDSALEDKVSLTLITKDKTYQFGDSTIVEPVATEKK